LEHIAGTFELLHKCDIDLIDFSVLQILSMKLAAVNPIIDFNLDSILAAEVSIIFSRLLKKEFIYLSLVWGVI